MKGEKLYTFKYLSFLYLDGQESRLLLELDKEPVYIVGVFVFVVHSIVAFHLYMPLQNFGNILVVLSNTKY